jgi:hypothetical protein
MELYNEVYIGIQGHFQQHFKTLNYLAFQSFDFDRTWWR